MSNQSSNDNESSSARQYISKDCDETYKAAIVRSWGKRRLTSNEKVMAATSRLECVEAEGQSTSFFELCHALLDGMYDSCNIPAGSSFHDIIVEFFNSLPHIVEHLGSIDMTLKDIAGSQTYVEISHGQIVEQLEQIGEIMKSYMDDLKERRFERCSNRTESNSVMPEKMYYPAHSRQISQLASGAQNRSPGINHLNNIRRRKK